MVSRLTNVQGLQGLINQLGQIGQGQLLGQFFNSLKPGFLPSIFGSSEIRRAAMLLNQLNKNGGEQLAGLLSRVMRREGGFQLVFQALNKKSILGLAGFLNTATGQAGRRAPSRAAPE